LRLQKNCQVKRKEIEMQTAWGTEDFKISQQSSPTEVQKIKFEKRRRAGSHEAEKRSRKTVFAYSGEYRDHEGGKRPEKRKKKIRKFCGKCFQEVEKEDKEALERGVLLKPQSNRTLHYNTRKRKKGGTI